MSISTPTPTDPAGPPPTVRTAFRLYVATAGLQALGALVAAVVMPRVASSMARHGELPPGEAAAAASPLARVALVGFALVLLALELFLAFRMRSGRNWARVVVLVLAVVELASLALDNDWASTFSIGPLGVISVVLQIVAFALLLVTTSLLLRPSAARWFRGTRA